MQDKQENGGIKFHISAEINIIRRTPMQITHLKVENFKGIRELDWTLSNRMVCLIGPGDSTKSTILDAIEFALWPSWNLQVVDNDFFQGDTTKPIRIEVTIGDIPQEFYSDDKYGLQLRGNIFAQNDEPKDGDDCCLTVRLQIDDSLEPEWRVVNNRSEGKVIPYKDRAKLCVNRVGTNIDKDFTLGRNSVLNRIGSKVDGIENLILSVSRTACATANEGGMCDTSKIMDQMTNSAKEFGVRPQDTYCTKIDIKSFNMSVSAISVHDGNVPLRAFGLGTRKLISMGMNVNCSDAGAIVLIDEIETGIEPYRLRQLIKRLEEMVKEKGQVIITSHSPVVVTELNVENIVITRSISGKTECRVPPAELQRTVRFSSEALLSPRVLVCEGKTECGICRGIDQYYMSQEKIGSAYKGVYFVDGGGNAWALKRAKELRELGYDVSLFMDSDAIECNGEADDLKKTGIEVIRWRNNVSTDQQVFLDMPWPAIHELIKLAVSYKGEESVLSSIKLGLSLIGKTDNLNVDEWHFDDRQQGEGRTILGEIAKKNSWYKNIDQGEGVGQIIMKYYDPAGATTDLVRVVTELKQWIYGNDTATD